MLAARGRESPTEPHSRRAVTQPSHQAGNPLHRSSGGRSHVNVISPPSTSSVVSWHSLLFLVLLRRLPVLSSTTVSITSFTKPRQHDWPSTSEWSGGAGRGAKIPLPWLIGRVPWPPRAVQAERQRIGRAWRSFRRVLRPGPPVTGRRELFRPRHSLRQGDTGPDRPVAQGEAALLVHQQAADSTAPWTAGRPQRHPLVLRTKLSGCSLQYSTKEWYLTKTAKGS